MIASGSHLNYAQALYKVAEKNGAAGQVLADLEALTVLLKDAKLNGLMKKIAYLEQAKLRQLIALTFNGKIQEWTLNAITLLCGAKKIWLLPRVVEAYRQIYYEAKGMVEVLVCAIRKLHKAEELGLTEKFEKKLKKPVSVRFEENPQLIGGVQIFERGHVTDFSLKNYLDYLRRHLMKINN